MKVTNLNDSGPGSLRAAVERWGARTVIFEVSGTIYLKRELKIRNPYITIAGQTAPSPGITLRGAEVNVKTHDVLIQHIRVRMGDRINSSDPGGADTLSVDGAGSYRVVIDHVSISWGIDENASSWYDSIREVTFSNCIISEALYDSIHPKGPHSMGLLVSPNARNFAMIGNLLAHDADRNPLISNGASAVVANNVFYNWKGGKATNIGNSTGSIRTRYATLAAIVGNVYIGGRDTSSSSYAIAASAALNWGSKIYYKDNRLVKIGRMFRRDTSFNPLVSRLPIWIGGFKAKPAYTVEGNVLANVGARPQDRDAVDRRVIDSVRRRTGRIINSPGEVGGFPSLPVRRRAIKIPPYPHRDDDRDGYTNFEEKVLFPMAARLEGRL